MHITDLDVLGLGPGGRLACLGLERATVLGGDPQGLTAMVDALDLFFATLDGDALRHTLWRMGFTEDLSTLQVVGDPLPDRASWVGADAARALLTGPDRSIRIQVDISLDPLQFRSLREWAVRSPDLVSALSVGPTLRVIVGWTFERSLEAVSLGIAGVEIGGVRVPSAGVERPEWLTPFLRGLVGRFCALPRGWRGRDPVAVCWRDALLSSDPARQRAHDALSRALAGLPFGLERARPVRWNREGCRVVAGPSLRPVETFGPGAVEGVEVAAAVHLLGAEILAFQWPGRGLDPAEVRAWLSRQAEDDASPLEQVILLDPDAPDARKLGS